MNVSYQTDPDVKLATKRPLASSLARGWKGHCPNCGEGKLFNGYLKVVGSCPSCSEEFSHHRADDAPPYVTIVLVGHLLIGILLHLEMVWRVPPMVYIFTLLPLAVILPLLLLPPIKGTIVALQWANRMHGFDEQFTPEFDAEDDGRSSSSD